MSFPPNEPNPYAAPTTSYAPVNVGVTGLSPENSKVVKDFRAQSLALGVVWIIFGTLLLVACVAILAITPPEGMVLNGPVMAGVMAVFATCWFAAGVGTLMKQIWGVYFGLAMSYLALFGNLLNLNICGLVIIVFVLLQAHRVLGFANKLRAANIPLNSMP